MRRGMTLVELLVVLVLLGLVAGISALGLGTLHEPGLAVTSDAKRMSAARAEAIRTGQPVLLQRDSGGPVLYLPEGRAVGGGVDPLTGAPPDAR